MAEKFLKAPEPVGQLYYDCILLDGDEPVLFTCTNNRKELYYCVCIYNVLGAQEWLITKTTPKWMCRLLKNEITMRHAITVKEKIWFAKECRNGHIEWEYKDVNDFPDDYLPTDRIYMDADDGEFDEELKHYTAMLPQENPRSSVFYRDLKYNGNTFYITGSKDLHRRNPYTVCASAISIKHEPTEIKKGKKFVITKDLKTFGCVPIKLNDSVSLTKKKIRVKKSTLKKQST